MNPTSNFPVRVYSLRWFNDLFGNPVWLAAIRNSLVTADAAMLIAPHWVRWPQSG